MHRILLCAAFALVVGSASAADGWSLNKDGRLERAGFTIEIDKVGDRAGLFVLRDPEGRVVYRSQVLKYLKGEAEEELKARAEFVRRP